jgi:hypothetical protein
MIVALVGVAGYVWYFHQEEVQVALRQLEAKVRPCRTPITYSIGSIDKRFGITKSVLVADLKEAEAIWEKPSGKDLFEYTASGGVVVVNLVYDNRQAATDKLQAAGIQIDKSKDSYDALKVQYDSLSARVEAEQAQHERELTAYKSHEAAYNAQVQQWNKRGGAPKDVYENLQAQKAALETELASLNTEQARLNSDIETVNALATTINQLIVQLNLNVKQYNQVGASQGEFEEGLYESALGSQRIDIYEYSNHNELVRVLAHELGHALGLGHVADPEAIMYKINKSENLKLVPADIAALNTICTAGVF